MMTSYEIEKMSGIQKIHDMKCDIVIMLNLVSQQLVSKFISLYKADDTMILASFIAGLADACALQLKLLCNSMDLDPTKPILDCMQYFENSISDILDNKKLQ